MKPQDATGYALSRCPNPACEGLHLWLFDGRNRPVAILTLSEDGAQRLSDELVEVLGAVRADRAQRRARALRCEGSA